MLNLAKYNLHWREGFFYGYDKRRDLYYELLKYTDVRPAVGVIGLRRTGKTVLLKQVIDNLVEKGVEREKILYFSFDETVFSLEELIGEYQARIGVELGKAGKVYIFLDEVQKLEGWQDQLKYYYDSYPEIKFFVSGLHPCSLERRLKNPLQAGFYSSRCPC